jgi:regulatory protein
MAARRARPARGRDAPRPVLDAAGARRVAGDLLSRKSWSTRELRARLRRRGAPAEVAEAVVADLERRGYLDDPAFARRWAESRAGVRRVGSLRLAGELRAKGIAPAAAESAVRAAFEEVPEEERALEAGRRRLAQLRKGAPERIGGRLRDHLLRRGYPGGLVQRVLRRLLPGLEIDPSTE